MDTFALIVGLGNPGPRYARNRHNIGFRAVDDLAAACNLTFSRTEQRALTAHGTINNQRVILAKPQTWMNESGQAVGPLVRFYKIPIARLLVIYDDLDLAAGAVRYRPDGSSGGHRGLQSISQSLGGINTIARVKVGIGRPPGRMDPADYVLQDFSKDEEPQLWEALKLAQKMTLAWLSGDEASLKTAMTLKVQPPT